MSSPHARSHSLPLQGALSASGQPFARHEQSPGLFVSGLTPERAGLPREALRESA